MESLKVNKTKPTKQEIQKVVSVLEAGGVVVFPTETVYSLAVDATNEAAIKTVYELKGRGFKKPLHVVVANLEMAEKYVVVNALARKLAAKFLPGPLTLVLPKKPLVLPEILTAGFPTLGIRIPNLNLALIVAKTFKKPYTTTSANLSGGPNPYSVNEVTSQFAKDKQALIDLVVDIGELPHLLPSTLVDLISDQPKILREGPVSKEEIEEVLGLTIMGET